MNNNISDRNNQAFFKDPLNIAYWLGGSMPATFVPEYLSSNIFTEARMKMTNELFRYMNMHDVAFPSHTTLAKSAGLKRQAAYEYFKWAEDIGLFKIIHRGKSWESNIYFLGDVLKNSAVRWALRHVFKGLHRAFMKTVKVLNEAANLTKRTLLLNNNVFKKNTSQGDYKEIKLHTSPYIKNSELYHNMKKALWADWSITEDDYRRDMQVIDQELLFDCKTQEEIRKDRKYQQFKRNDAKYPTMYKDMAEKFNFEPYIDNNKKPKPLDLKISSTLMNQRISMCKKEPDLSRRLAMYDKLKTQVERGSIAYIDFLINKTKRNIES